MPIFENYIAVSLITVVRTNVCELQKFYKWMKFFYVVAAFILNITYCEFILARNLCALCIGFFIRHNWLIRKQVTMTLVITNTKEFVLLLAYFIFANEALSRKIFVDYLPVCNNIFYLWNSFGYVILYYIFKL